MSIIDYFRPRTKERLLRGEHVHWVACKRGNYIRQCVLSFPPWVDRQQLQSLWQQAKNLEAKTGIPHVLDHIVPINHAKVCGLSVPWNFEIIPRRHNDAKGNKWSDGDAPDQLHLPLQPRKELTMACEKHQWEFKGNKRFVKAHFSTKGSSVEVSIRALHICKACGKESKRTPNPNFPMPKL